jgi:hypothetical protein
MHSVADFMTPCHLARMIKSWWLMTIRGKNVKLIKQQIRSKDKYEWMLFDLKKG